VQKEEEVTEVLLDANNDFNMYDPDVNITGLSCWTEWRELMDLSSNQRQTVERYYELVSIEKLVNDKDGSSWKNGLAVHLHIYEV